MADGAGAFFGGALGVERAEVGEDGFVAGAGREGDGGVEVVVVLAEDGDEAVFVNELFLGVGRLFVFPTRSFTEGRIPLKG